jgi:hypothetical protein
MRDVLVENAAGIARSLSRKSKSRIREADTGFALPGSGHFELLQAYRRF